MQEKSLNAINALPDIRSFLKSAHEVKYLLILTLCSSLFQNSTYVRVLLKLL